MIVDEPLVAVPGIPYRGIHPFRYADHAIFFAREEETGLLERLVAVYRGVFLYGGSGSGKSSLVNAGLLPQTSRLGLAPVRVRVQPRAGEEIVVEPIAISDDDAEVMPCMLVAEADRSSGAVLSVAEFEQSVRGASQEHRLLLVFDQFEEILTLFEDVDAVASRRALTEMILRLLREPLPVKLLFAFREDYLGKVKQLLAACPELVDQSLRLGPPSADALEMIIRGPFVRFPGRFEHEFTPAVAQQLRAALAERFGAGELSLSEVQTVCLRLWRSPDPEALLAEKGVQGLLEDELGEALDAFPSDVRTAAIALLSQMVTSEGTRNVVSAEDLRQRVREEDTEISRALLDEALDRLERESKLVRRERRRDLYLYEITSEFLVPWISRRREKQRLAHERRRERRRLRILASISGGLLILTALVAALAIWAIGQRAEANHQRDTARSRELAASVTSLGEADPGLSLALARRAVAFAPTEQAVNALRQAVLRFRELSTLRAGQVRGHGADLSPDGRLAVSASGNGTLRIWDLRSRRAVKTVQAHRGTAFATRFSPDGSTVVSAGNDGVVVATDVATGRRRVIIPKPGAGARSLAIARDEDRVAIGYQDGTVRIADVTGSADVRVLRGPKGWVFGVALSDDLTRVAAAAQDGTVRVWDLRGNNSPVVLHRHASSSVSFRPGHAGRLISSGLDGWIRFWNVSSGVEEGKVRADDQAIFAARFSSDGQRIVAGGEDGAIRTIDAASKRVTAVMRGHSGGVYDVNFSSKSDEIISTGQDGTIRRWDPETARVIRGPVTEASISSDERHIVAGGTDHTVRIWRVASGMLEAELRGHTRISHARFSRDARQVISWSGDRSVRVWDVGSEQAQHVFRDHDGEVHAAAFDPAGGRIVSGGGDSRIVMRSLTGGRPVIFNGHRGIVTDVSFSRNGTQLLSTGEDATIKIWDAQRPSRRPRELLGHSAMVHAATFSPNGQKVVSAGSDGTVRVWTLRGQRPVVLRGHEGAVHSAAFNPAGDRIVSTGIDGSIRIWNPHGGEPLVTLHEHHGRAWSASFSANGSDVLSSGRDRTVWLAPCEVCGSTADIRRLAQARAERRLSSTERQRFLSTP